jgi:hypothetical protein
MSLARTTPVVFCLLAPVAPLALAGGPGPGTASDGAASYAFDFDEFIDGEADWTPNAFVGEDQLFQSWWWYRVDGETSETSFADGLPGFIEYFGDTASFQGTEPNGLGYLMTWVVDDEAGTLTSTVRVTNTGDDPVVVNLFHYADLDLAGTIGSDEAVQTGPTSMNVFDDGVEVEYTGEGADLWMAGNFPSVRDLLTDNAADDLDNTGLAFGPGDFSGAFQWQNRTIGAGQTLSFSATLDAIPSPGGGALFAAVGLGALRRRR